LPRTMTWGGVSLEINQVWRGHFEEITSNDAGAIFAAYYYDDAQSLGPPVEAFLNERACASTPEELKKYAERYKRLPASEKAAQADCDKNR
jgi:hypothetical protein